MDRRVWVWASLAVVFVTLATLGGLWAIQRATDSLIANERALICVNLAQTRVLVLAVSQASGVMVRELPPPGSGNYDIVGSAFDDDLPSTTSLCGKSTQQVLDDAAKDAAKD